MHRFLFPLYCALLAVVCRFAVCIQTQLISFFVDEIIIFRLAVKQFLFLNFHHSYDCRNLIPPVNFSRVNKIPPIHSTQHDQLSTQKLSSSLPTQKIPQNSVFRILCPRIQNWSYLASSRCLQNFPTPGIFGLYEDSLVDKSYFNRIVKRVQSDT